MSLHGRRMYVRTNRKWQLIKTSQLLKVGIFLIRDCLVPVIQYGLLPTHHQTQHINLRNALARRIKRVTHAYPMPGSFIFDSRSPQKKLATDSATSVQRVDSQRTRDEGQ